MAASEHVDKAELAVRMGETFVKALADETITLQAEVERLTLLADARGVALAQLREISQSALRVVWRLMARMEGGGHDAQMDAYLDAKGPVQAWREFLAQPDPDQRGSEILAAADAMLSGIEADTRDRRERQMGMPGPVTKTRRAVDDAAAAYRRLRGATTSATAEPHKNSADF